MEPTISAGHPEQVGVPQRPDWCSQLVNDIQSLIIYNRNESASEIQGTKEILEEVKRSVEEVKNSIDEIKRSLAEIKESPADDEKPTSAGSNVKSPSETEDTGLFLIEDEPSTGEHSIMAKPVVVEPSVTGYVVEGPTAEQPAVKEPAADEPTTEESAFQDFAIEKPVIEEPAVEEPAVEESTREEYAAKKPAIDESVTNNTIPDDNIAEKLGSMKDAGAEAVAEKQPGVKPQILSETLETSSADALQAGAQSPSDSPSPFSLSSEYPLNIAAEVERSLTHSQESSDMGGDDFGNTIDDMIHFPAFGSESPSLANDDSVRASGYSDQSLDDILASPGHDSDNTSDETSGTGQPTPDSMSSGGEPVSESEDMDQSLAFSAAFNAHPINVGYVAAVAGGALLSQNGGDDDWEAVGEVENGEEFSL